MENARAIEGVKISPLEDLKNARAGRVGTTTRATLGICFTLDINSTNSRVSVAKMTLQGSCSVPVLLEEAGDDDHSERYDDDIHHYH